MVDVIRLSVELMQQPIGVMQIACMLGLKSIFVLTHIWLLLVRTIISFNLDLSWKAMVWTFAVLSLPIRILTAFHRERLLQMHLYAMQHELENLAWQKKQLDEQLQITIKDCRIMGAIISELEEENDKAFGKIELLESEVHNEFLTLMEYPEHIAKPSPMAWREHYFSVVAVKYACLCWYILELQDLREENTRLTEIYEDSKWSFRAQDDDCYENAVENVKQDPSATDYEKSLLKTISIPGEEITEDLVHADKSKDKAGRHIGPVSPFSSSITRRSSGIDEGFYQHREVAMSQSIFSALLSLCVGMIIWEAKDPCMPLVIALFIVVGMSLRSVTQFFFTIRNRPASDAVTLLSFNWFILGTLTYPTLPIVARLLMPSS